MFWCYLPLWHEKAELQLAYRKIPVLNFRKNCLWKNMVAGKGNVLEQGLSTVSDLMPSFYKNYVIIPLL